MPNAFLLSDFVDQTIVERLHHVVGLGFGMVDELEGVGHRLLGSSERLWESLAEIFDASRERKALSDQPISHARSLPYYHCCSFRRFILA